MVLCLVSVITLNDLVAMNVGFELVINIMSLFLLMKYM